MSWIEITDDLDSFPPENTPVFVCLEDGRHTMAEHVYVNEDEGGYMWARIYDVPYVHRGEWKVDNNDLEDFTVTHWHKLPDIIEAKATTPESLHTKP
jgi:hypothetical protein